MIWEISTLHEGHRQRMYEKLNSGDDLYDHELLEILLYSACPRVNTNPIAHMLLDRFVTLEGVFTASLDELKAVEGVGENVAKFIKTVGQCAERAGKIGSAPALKTLGDCKRFLNMRFNLRTEECIEIYFVNKSFKVVRIFNYTTYERGRAGANIETIARSVAYFRPYGIVLAHNHIDGTLNPSVADDYFTNAVQFVCNMNDVLLLDHLIYYKDGEIFSYRDSNLLEKSKNTCNWEAFEKWIKTLN